MTAYRGSYTAVLNSDPGSPFGLSIAITATLTLSEVRLLQYDGSVTYKAAFAGTVTRTTTGPDGVAQTVQEAIPAIWGSYFTSPSAFWIPFPLENFPGGFNLSPGFFPSADRSTLTFAQDGRFSTSANGFGVAGSMQVRANLVATTNGFNIAPASAVEGNSGVGEVVFTVTRLGGLSEPASVAFTYASLYPHVFPPGSMTQFGLVSFAPGQATQKLPIRIQGDLHNEPDQTFTVTLVHGPEEFMLPKSSAVGTVIDDDADVQLVLQDYPGGYGDNEGNDLVIFAQNFPFSVYGSAPPADVFLDWRVVPIGLHPADGADFEGGVLPSGRIHVLGGTSNFWLPIRVQPDAEVEPDETFRIEFSSPDPAIGIPYRHADSRIIADDPIADFAGQSSGGGPLGAAPAFYPGPVAGLDKQFVDLSEAGVVVAVGGPGWFLRSGAGNDALAAASGTNVLDGGTGSNFLAGGSGADTFFVDLRAAGPDTWSTLSGFAAGDGATLWGIGPTTHDLAWIADAGAPGHTGLTLRAAAPGRPAGSVTLPGYGPADLQNGRLSVQFSTEPASGSPYMYLFAAA